MKASSAHSRSAAFTVISWAFGIALIVFGVLNLLLVHPVPGLFYLLLSVFYLPPTDTRIRSRLGFSIPPGAKVMLGLVVLWGTLAMSELAERFD